MSKPQPPEGAVEAMARSRWEQQREDAGKPAPTYDQARRTAAALRLETTRDLQAAYPAILKDLEERLLGEKAKGAAAREIARPAEPSSYHRDLANVALRAALDSVLEEER